MKATELIDALQQWIDESERVAARNRYSCDVFAYRRVLLRRAVDALRAELDEAGDEYEQAETRRHLRQCFAEADRLRVGMTLTGEGDSENYIPMLAKRLAERLGAARTPKEEKSSEVLAQRFEELRQARRSAGARVAALEAALRGASERLHFYAPLSEMRLLERTDALLSGSPAEAPAAVPGETYRCAGCGDYVAEADVNVSRNIGQHHRSHTVARHDRHGYATPEQCGPVDRAPAAAAAEPDGAL